ncbi:MAG: hypothetical protein ACOX0A_09445 [Thermoguttaceae bacterium]|jgi:hypothetical protein
MKRIVALSMTLLASAIFATGCCKSGGEAPPSDASVPQVAPENNKTEELEQDEEPLDVENEETPEGVVNSFFRSFFRGASEDAFALLSSKAQEAQSENFAAQASETIRWRVVEKTKPTTAGVVYVWIEVEDYAETGEIQRDLLTFSLTDDDGDWRVAGFNVGDVAVDFEESVIVAQEAPVAPGEVRAASRIERVSVRR